VWAVFPFKKRFQVHSPFGPIVHPQIIHKENFNPGIDFKCPPGTELLSSIKGKAKIVFDDELQANVLQIFFKNKSLTRGYFLYKHVSDIKVKNNQKVLPGEVVALSGPGEIFHFEINYLFQKNKPSPVNPKNYVCFA